MPIELPPVDPCPFCERIVGRRDDWAVIEARDDAICFVNPRQFEVGQALVIPRRHAPTLLDLSEQENVAIAQLVRDVARALLIAYDPDGLTIYQNNGVASMQEIPHLHVHVVPRRSGSGWGEGPPHIAALERGERRRDVTAIAAPIDQQQQAAAAIRAALGAAS
jgi:histidine triad (HIT) family protein